MQLQIIILSEVSRKEKDKPYVVSLIRGIYNMAKTNLSIKQKQTRGHQEQTGGF